MFGGGGGDLSGNMGSYGAMSGAGIGQLLAGYTNPASKAMPYLNQIQNQISPYLNPYMQAGQGAINNLQGQYGNLLNNPGGFVNSVGQQFKQSPGYQFQVDQATSAANRAAAAGGYLGSPQEQVGVAGTVNNLANQDYYNWLNKSLGAYGQGLQGEQGLGQLGFGSAEDMSNAIAQALAAQAQLAYAGQADKNETKGGEWGEVLGGLGGAAGSAGGAALSWL